MFDPRTIVLTPTPTYSRRIAVWMPMPHPYPDRLCILTVDQHGKLDWDWYGVEEWPPRDPGSRRFELRKWGHADASEVAQVGARNQCTCPAGSKGRRRECKHQDALLAITNTRRPEAESNESRSPIPEGERA